MNIPHLAAEVLENEPSLMGMWLAYGSISLVGFLLCQWKARWLVLFLPLSVIACLPGVGELRNMGPAIYGESPLYYPQLVLGLTLALLGPMGGAVLCLRRNPRERLQTVVWAGPSSPSPPCSSLSSSGPAQRRSSLLPLP